MSGWGRKLREVMLRTVKWQNWEVKQEWHSDVSFPKGQYCGFSLHKTITDWEKKKNLPQDCICCHTHFIWECTKCTWGL